VRRRFAGGMGSGVEAEWESVTEMVSSRDRVSNLGSSVNSSESMSDRGDPGESSGAMVVKMCPSRLSGVS
jgi:hypothetical protein